MALHFNNSIAIDVCLILLSLYKMVISRFKMVNDIVCINYLSRYAYLSSLYDHVLELSRTECHLTQKYSKL